MEENLILLCRNCHSVVHGTIPSGGGEYIGKQEAQEILFALIEMPGVTGIALRRQWKAKKAREEAAVS